MAVFRRYLPTVATLALVLGIGPAWGQAQPPVKIGFPGAHKVYIGAQLLKGAQLATAMINEKGGVLGGRKIELVVYDTGFSPAEGVSAVQRLINENGVKNTTSLIFMGVMYLLALGIYLGARWYRKRREGIDLGLIYKEIPVE